MNSSELRVVLITVPDEDSAGSIAGDLVEKRLAACVNIIPNLRSIYRWENKIEDSSELLLLAKTSAERYHLLESRVLEIHPYDTPEIISLDVKEGFDTYCAWVLGETSP